MRCQFSSLVRIVRCSTSLKCGPKSLGVCRPEAYRAPNALQSSWPRRASHFSLHVGCLNLLSDSALVRSFTSILSRGLSIPLRRQRVGFGKNESAAPATPPLHLTTCLSSLGSTASSREVGLGRPFISRSTTSKHFLTLPKSNTSFTIIALIGSGFGSRWLARLSSPIPSLRAE